ncbi:ubiquitin carboxyl-terminal hydrolase isoform X2 [Oratosquilla oratoria]|uniref:ubiquitin carboxyl-terminal hydrolase isoform X2 n=1 Tax=Oratosquilla oratoria TaxID=337810 RepID=UPI003F75B91A
MVRWLPLESNPEFMTGLGVPSTWAIHDVYGMDDDLLAMVPQPVAALLLLYPLTSKADENKTNEEKKIEKDGQDLSPNLYFMKQFVGNACGTVALVHAIANNTDKIKLDDGALKEFISKTKGKNPEDRGHALEEDEGISQAHEESAQEGQTEAPDRESKLDTHFIALVEQDGHLYELDGRKKFPINHGSSAPASFLQDAAKVCRTFMESDPGESRFAVVALAASD